ncbi:MAG: FHA domain-containing protein [Myxococcales bacterium]|jgi:predicted component of type VI protein secretion system|nr:FHA domain-containing protein [Myxococcales bacterium]
MRFRLRYLQHDLELTEGTFAVGRNASCQLSLDDPLVSRRHALFEVSPHGVTVEDLESRNGVLVNGQRIETRMRLTVGDRILIGSQELTLLAARDAQVGGGGVGKMTLPKMRVTTPSSSYRPAQVENDPEPSMVRRADQFKLLSGVAEKALAMGRAGEAERLLASALADVIEATRANRPLPPTLVDQAAKFSAKLATATGKGGWADYVVELYQAQKRPCPAGVIDELYNAMRKVTAVDMNRLRAYISLLRQNLHRYGPAERFLFQRIEGLERLAALR